MSVTSNIMYRTVKMPCLMGLLLGLLVSCTSEQNLGTRPALDAANDATSDAGAETDACTPSCGGRECGSDGCGGLCGTCGPSATCNAESARCESECVPECDGNLCGDDGCGGVCGSVCPDDRECRLCLNEATCATVSRDCRCPAAARLTYEFDGNGIDWTDIESIELSVSHFGVDGASQPDRDAVLREGDESDTYRYEVAGCVADVQVRRVYQMRDGIDCEFTDRVRRADIVIPTSAVGGVSCTAPPL